VTPSPAIVGQYANCESINGATLTMAIILDRSAKFFHCCKQH